MSLEDRIKQLAEPLTQKRNPKKPHIFLVVELSRRDDFNPMPRLKMPIAAFITEAKAHRFAARHQQFFAEPEWEVIPVPLEEYGQTE